MRWAELSWAELYPRPYDKFSFKFADRDKKPKRTRKLFPESWLYIDFERTPEGGLHIQETVPDTITTWAITGFSIHPDTGLTFTRNTTNLKVFQQFFVSFDFPNSAREGEIIEVPIYISNYLDQDALTRLTIESNSQELDILEHPQASSMQKLSISRLISTKQRDKLLAYFKPLKPGEYNVSVTVVSPAASDAVQKTLHIQSQGISYAMSRTHLVHLADEGVKEDKIKIDIPKDAMPGSQRVEVSVVGDIFRPLMAKLQELARVPYGNGEDNMRLIVSNSIVLKYLKTLNYSNPSLENKIRFNLELGYQNQLSFKFLDGSFGLVERTVARTGDIWQTLLALWGLHLAKDFVQIDPRVRSRGLEYLKSRQQENGCYKSERGLEEDVKFTAFGLIVFLMDENSRKTYSDVISRGLEYLLDISDDLEYSPVSVMSTYVLLLVNHEQSAHYLTRLTTRSRLKSKQVQWTKSDTLQSYVETTAESLINLFEYQEIPQQSLLHIVRGLIVPKQADSSITHMVALQAMIGFVEKLTLNRNDLKITFKDDRNKSATVQLNSNNSRVSQAIEVAQSSRNISIQSKGQGFAVVEVKYKYNLPPANQSSSIYSTDISSRKTSSNLGVLKVCLSFDKAVQSEKGENTAITRMEVNLQSGCTFDDREEELVGKLDQGIKSIQVSNGREKATIYIGDTFSSTSGACTELKVRRNFNIFNSKPGWVVVDDAHDKDQRATTTFNLNDF